MPLSIDPSASLWLSLATDRDKPEATRPAFRCQFLTVRQRLQMDRLYAEAVAGLESEGPGGGSIAYANDIAQALAIAVIDWRNLRTPFSEDAFHDVLTFEEMAELFWLCINESSAKARELFRCASASRSATEASARNAGAENAMTSPATSNRSSSDAPAAASPTAPNATGPASNA